MNKTIPVSVIIRSMDRPTLLRALDSVCAQGTTALRDHRRRGLWRKTPPAASGSLGYQNFVWFLVERDSLDRPRAANRGLDSATPSDWIAFLDGDDEYPHHLSTL